MRMTQVFLLVQALALMVLGLAYFIQPHEMTNISGMLLMAPAAITDVRAYYGGLQIGLGMFLLLACRQLELLRGALTLLVLLGVMLYHSPRVTLVMLVLAPLIGLISSAVARRYRRINRGIQDGVANMAQVAEQALSAQQQAEIVRHRFLADRPRDDLQGGRRRGRGQHPRRGQGL